MDPSPREVFQANLAPPENAPSQYVPASQDVTQPSPESGADSADPASRNDARGAILEHNVASAVQESATRAVACYTRLESLLDQLETRIEQTKRARPLQKRPPRSVSWSSRSSSSVAAHSEVEETEEPRILHPTLEVAAPLKVLPEIKECDFENFVNRFSPHEDLCAIEVLLGGPSLLREIKQEKQRRHESTGLERPNTPQIPKTSFGKQWIHEMRIQSPELLRIFSRVTGYDWVHGTNRPHTFQRPFKYFIHFHEQFKKELSRMKNIGNTDTEASEDLVSQPPIVNHREAATLDVTIRTTDETNTEPSKNVSRNDEATNSTRLPGIEDLQCYINFVEDRILPSVNRFQQFGSESSLKVRFDELWYLFKPGDLLFVPPETLTRLTDKISVARRVVPTTSESSMSQRVWRIMSTTEVNSSFRVGCFYLEYSGCSYAASGFNIGIEHFKGEKSIFDLECYPLRLISNHVQILNEYREQGQKHIEAISRQHYTYNGWTFVTHPIGLPLERGVGRDVSQRMPRFIDGDVIVDYQEILGNDPRSMVSLMDLPPGPTWSDTCSTTYRELPHMIWDSTQRESLLYNCRDILVTDNECGIRENAKFMEGCPYLRRKTWPRTPPDGEDLALLPPRVFAYSLRQLFVGPVNVNLLKPIQNVEDPFRLLQLPDEHKRMIKAAMIAYTKRQETEITIGSGQGAQMKTQDFILGKGSGLLIMLHGEPGVGKTATAEAVSQSTKRPLFSIPCSDYTDPDELDRIFRLAHQWGCVLLMDEADVLLSARTGQSTYNASVSTFLQKMEYYKGILILTTNRIGKLDAAVSSRIHLILHYKRLGPSQIESIFRINVKQLQEIERKQHEVSGETPLFILEQDVMRFAADHCNKHPKGKGAWNGRQIRNAFVIAASLARFEVIEQGPAGTSFQPQLRYMHFQQVEAMTDQFNRFRSRVLGGDDSRKARLNEERDDDFDDEETDSRSTSNADAMFNLARLLSNNRLSETRLSPQSFNAETSNPQGLASPYHYQQLPPRGFYGHNPANVPSYSQQGLPTVGYNQGDSQQARQNLAQAHPVAMPQTPAVHASVPQKQQ